MFQGKPIENVVMQAPSRFIHHNESGRVRVNGAALQRARAAKQREQELVIASAIIAAETAASEMAKMFVPPTTGSITKGIRNVSITNLPSIPNPQDVILGATSIPNSKNVIFGDPYVNPLSSSSHREVCKKKPQDTRRRYAYMCAFLLCVCCVGVGVGTGVFFGFRQWKNDDVAHSPVPFEIATLVTNTSDTFHTVGQTVMGLPVKPEWNIPDN